MSNKNDPYNYAMVYQQSQLQGEQKNLQHQDSDMEEILGTIQRDKSTPDKIDSTIGIVGKISNIFS